MTEKDLKKVEAELKKKKNAQVWNLLWLILLFAVFGILYFNLPNKKTSTALLVAGAFILMAIITVILPFQNTKTEIKKILRDLSVKTKSIHPGIVQGKEEQRKKNDLFFVIEISGKKYNSSYETFKKAEKGMNAEVHFSEHSEILLDVVLI